VNLQTWVLKGNMLPLDHPSRCALVGKKKKKEKPFDNIKMHSTNVKISNSFERLGTQKFTTTINFISMTQL
jgi:hypothetical protein